VAGVPGTAWLDSIADAGPIEEVELRCRRLVAASTSPLLDAEPPGADAPLIVAHDAPSTAAYAA